MSLSLFDTKDLEKGLDLCSLRNQVISSNIANANSPDYQAQVVTFEEQMREVSAPKSKQSRKFVTELTPTVQTVSGSVDIITEMASLSKNQILYHAYTNEITREFSNLKWIIDNAGR